MKKDPSLAGEDVTIDEHRLNVNYAGAIYVTSHHVPHYMPRALHLLVPWIDTFILAMNANTATFPAAFGGQFPFSAHLLTQMRGAYGTGVSSGEALVAQQRFMSTWRNIILFGRPERVLLEPPRPSPARCPRRPRRP